MRPLFLFCLIALCAACSDPMVMIPGGKLDGTDTAAPALWSGIPNTIQLETRPDDPYSINIWGVGIGEHLYIATGEDGTTWSAFIEADPAVRVRIGDNIYTLQGALVSDAAERAAVASAYAKKYELELDDNWVDTGLIFRLNR